MNIYEKLNRIAEQLEMPYATPKHEIPFPFTFKESSLRDALTAVYVFEYLRMMAQRHPLVHEEGQPGNVDRKKNTIARFEKDLKKWLDLACMVVGLAIQNWWQDEPNIWYAEDPIPEVERGLKLLSTVANPFKFLYKISNFQLDVGPQYQRWYDNDDEDTEPEGFRKYKSFVEFAYNEMPGGTCPDFDGYFESYKENKAYAHPDDYTFEAFLKNVKKLNRSKINEITGCIWSKWLHKKLRTEGKNQEALNQRKMDILDTAEATFKKMLHPSGSLSEQSKDLNVALNLVHNNGEMIDKIESFTYTHGLRQLLFDLTNGEFTPKCDKYLESLGFDLKKDEGVQPMYRKEEEGLWLPASRKARVRLTAIARN